MDDERPRRGDPAPDGSAPVARAAGGPATDFRAVFEATPTPFVVVAPRDLVIVAVSDAYLRATHTERAAILGRPLFDVFPDDPANPAATGVANLRASLQRVVATGRTDAMAVQHYPIPGPVGRDGRSEGAFEDRWWSPVNAPVLGPGGEVALVVHRVEDVTELVRLRDAGAAHDRLTRDQQTVIDQLRAANADAARAAARERESDERARALVAQLPGAAAFVVDRDLRYLLAEGEALGASGLAPADLVGRTVGEALGPAAEAEHAPLYRRALAGEPFAHEHAAHGRVYLTRGGPLRDAAGRVYAALAVSTDVTARRHAEAALEASEERAGLALDAADLGSFVWYPQDHRGEPDARMLALFGLPADDSLNLSAALAALIHPDDRARYAAAVARATDPAGDGTFREEVRVIRPNGAARWVVVTARAAFSGGASGGVGGTDAPRRAVRMSGVAADVTERRDAEDALRASEARYRALATASADMVYRMSADWGEMRQLDGRGIVLDSAEPSGAWPGRYIHPDDHARVTAVIAEAVRTRSPFALEHRVIRADGSPGWTSSRAVPVLDAAGAVVEWIGAARDVTARKEAELAVCESEARQTFLLELSDVLRALDDPLEIQRAAMETLGRRMGVNRALYFDVEPDLERLTCGPVYLQGVNPVPPVLRITDFGAFTAAAYRRGDAVAIADVHEDERFDSRDREAYTAVQTRAGVGVPLVQGDRLVALIGVNQATPRAWTPADLVLLKEVAERTWAATVRARAATALRASEARQAFLLALSDALRPLVDPVEIQGEAARLLGERLGAERALYTEHDADTVVVHRDWVRGVPSMAGRYPAAALGGEFVDAYRRGEPYVVADVAADPRLDDADRPAFRAMAIGAFVGVGLVKGGQLVASFGAHSQTPRAWTAEEVDLVRETAERTWAAVERARAELALRESEAKYRTIFDSIDEGFVTHEVLYDDAGRPVDLRYLEMNPAYERHTGVPGRRGRTAREILPNFEDVWIEAFARVAHTGESLRAEHYNEDTGRWYNAYLSRVGGDGSVVVAAVFNDNTERKRAEATLTAAAARDAFLVRLADALRPLADPVAVQAAAMRVLGEHFGAVRAQLWEAEPDGRHLVSQGGYARGLAPLAARIRPDDYGVDVSAIFRAGRTLAVADTAAHPLVGEAALAAYRAVGIASYVGVPLVKDGRWVAVLGLHRAEAHEWTPDEVALVEETAERTWAAVQRARAEAALRESEERYRLIVEGARDYVIVTTDADGCVESWSPGAEAVFGWQAAEAVGRPIEMLFLPEDRAAGVPEAERAAALAGGVASDVRWHGCKDGGRVFIEGTLRALRDERGGLRGFLKVGQDVTARRRLDEALQASEARVRTLVENVRDYAIFLLDAEGRVSEWPAGAERVKGYRPDEAVGRHLGLFYTPEDVAAGEPDRHLAEAAAEGRGEWEGWRVRKDGTRFWANEIATAVRDADGRLTGFTKISRDLTERRLAERAAGQAQQAAARDDLRRALAAAEEAERRRLARELHDQLGQHLTGFALGLAEARRRLGAVTGAGGSAEAGSADRGSAEAATAGGATASGAIGGVAASLARLEELARLMARDARTLALELRPPELDDVGLVSAVETYVREWSARTGVAAEVAVTGLHERALPADVASAVYRIVQEALTNVAKHAGAARASVIIEQPDGEVGLIVEDDGRGFDADGAATRARRDRRLGLAGMRERAALVGGTVTIESSPGGGTTVYVRLPVDPLVTHHPLGAQPAGGLAALLPPDDPHAAQEGDR